MSAARAFLGALLWLDAPNALDACRHVEPETDLVDPRLIKLMAAIVRLAERGIAPDPVAVELDLRGSGDVTGAEQTKAAGLLLIDLYGQAVTAGSVSYYRSALLSESLRRRVAMAGERLTQAAETGSDDSLILTVLVELDGIKAVRDRRYRAGQRVEVSA